MSKQIQVTMPDGSVWGVPAELVAQHRADYYGDKEGEESRKAEYDFTLSNIGELLDWAVNNMNWSNVSHAAVKIGPDVRVVDYQDGWVNGKKRVVDIQ